MKSLTLTGLLALILGASSAFAQTSPVGLWRTIDDETQQPKSEVRISESAQGLVGYVDRMLSKTARPDAVCDACPGERKGRPIVGLDIIHDAKKLDGQDTWEGTILDPENGKTYRLRLQPLDGGAKLQVRGYIGPFYRTQVWIRTQ